MNNVLIFALVLLSPLPFISPFGYYVQDAAAQSPFGPFGSDQNLPTDAIAQNTTTFDIVTSVTDLSASITSPDVSGISTSANLLGITSATINNTPYAIVSDSIGSIVYIINMTNLTSPSYVSNITDATIDGPNDVVTTTLNGSHYALVASYSNSSVSIINITNPISPNVVSTILNTSGTFRDIHTMHVVKIGVYTYALIPSSDNDTLSIINITEIEHPELISNFTDIEYSTLKDVVDLDTIEINNYTYAIVINTNNVQIINITNPISPNLTYTIIRANADYKTRSLEAVNIVEIDDLYYALVSPVRDNGIQIINITNPKSPTSTYFIEDGAEYPHVGDVSRIITTIVDNYTYALAIDHPSGDDDSIQIIDITNPESPNPVSAISPPVKSFLSGLSYMTSIVIEDSTYVLASSHENSIHIIKLESVLGQLFTITSSNPNNTYSKENDTITIELTVNDVINSSTVNILNQTAQKVVNDNYIAASLIVPSDPIEGNLTFEIMVENDQGATLTLTQDDLDDQHIFVDTIRPSITLIGNSSYSLLQFGDINKIPGATASDGSPGYTSDNYAITSSGNLNTSTIGSLVNYTYTADTDAAGNLGESTVRTVTIVPLSNDIHVENVTVNSTNTNNVSYAKAGDNVTITIVTDVHGFNSITGTILGDTNFENTTSNEILYLTKTIQSSDSNINFEFDILLVNDTVGNIRITQENLTGGNIIIDTIPPILTLNGENDTISLTNQEYIDANATAYDLSYGTITIGATNMVNQTIPGNQTLLYITPLDRAGNPGPNLTRNVIILEPLSIEIANDSFGMSAISAVNTTSPEDTDTIMINGSYYAITAGLYGIQITNITNPAFPISVSNVSLNNLTQVETITIKNSHYALAVKNDSVKIINITNPVSPFIVSEIPSGTINGSSLSITAIDAFTINGTNHYSIISLDFPEINSVIDNRMIQIIDITNPKIPDLIYDVSDRKYLNTSTGNIMTIEINNSHYALLSGAGSESVRILNITNPILPDLVYYDFIDSASDTIKVDYIQIGNSHYVLFGSGNSNGFRAINITNLAAPFTISNNYIGNTGSTGTYAHTQIDGSHYAIISDSGDARLYILNITTLNNPVTLLNAADDLNGYEKIDDIDDIETITINGFSYIVTTSEFDNGLQILRLGKTPFYNITSSNTDPAYAKKGDTITVHFTTNDTITDHNVTILNQTPSTSVVGGYLKANIQVPDIQMEEYPNITISVESIRYSNLAVTEHDLPEFTVFVDTIRPNVSLLGNETYPIAQHSQLDLDQIPGVTVYDGSPRYAFGYDLNKSSPININQIGSSAIYTYTAHPDAAGNLGYNVTRNVIVIEYNPITIKTLTISGDNSVNSSYYARAGDTITIALTVDGKDFGNMTTSILGTYVHDHTPFSGILFFEKSITQSDTNGNATFSIRVTNSTGYSLFATNENLTAPNIIIDTIAPSITLNGDNNTASTLNLPYVDANATAYDLSYGNRTVQSTGFVNTSALGNYTITYTAPDDYAGNPGQIITRNVIIVPPLPIEIANDPFAMSAISYVNIDTPEDAGTIMINGSYYTITVNSYGMQITNITNPAIPTRVSSVPLSYLTQVETITIENSHYALAVKSDSVKIINITNPVSPLIISEILPGTINGSLLSINTIGTLTINNTNHYSIISLESPTVNSMIDYRVIKIINITNPAIPDLIYNVSNTEYLNASTRNIITFEINNSYYAALSGSLVESIIILNITNPILPDLLYYNFIDPASDTTDINYLQIGNSHYILHGSSNSNGFRATNITDLTAPYIIGDYFIGKTGDTGTFTHTQIDGSHYAIVSDGEAETINILNITDITNPISLLAATDGMNGYERIDDPIDMDIIKINGFSYVIATSDLDNGFQIIRFGKTPLYNITSNNTDPVYAKKGDTITAHLTINDTIGDHNVTILNQTPSTSVMGDYLNASIIVPDIQMEGYPNITISVESTSLSNLIVTEHDLPEFTVFVDTIRPTVSLIGNETYNIIQYSTLDQIPGIIAYDGSPGYVSKYDLNKSNDIDTDQIGSSAIYTYTAHPDAAGNPGYNVTRNVIVIESDPIIIDTLTISGDNSVNSSFYARAGDTLTITLTVDSTDLGNVTASILGESTNDYVLNPPSLSLNRTITQSDTNGNLTFNIRATNSSGHSFLVTSENLTSSNIIIDTIAPNIALNGTNNTESIIGYPYTDANATAYDLSYGSKIIQPTGFVNTSTLGNYTITYTAPDDYAGNPGPTITRNVIVRTPPPIIMQALSIHSTNTDNSYAKTGDNITVQLTINDTITAHDVEILNDTFSPTITTSANNLNVSITVSNIAIEKHTTFNITVENEYGVKLSVVPDNLSTDSIFVDTIQPTITLNGDANPLVLVNSSYADLGAVSSDGDPNYVQTYTITNNSILNTTQIGSTVIYTYTANSDGAGNLGTNIIRNVTVVDYSPLNITSLSVSSNNSNNSYAKAGDQVNITIVTDGSDVGNMTGIILGSDNFTQNSSGGTIYLTKNIMQNDTNGNLTFNIRVTNSSEYAARVTHEDLIVDNIIIDTIRPNITLNGENNTVLMIDNPYTDAGATIYDLSYGSKIIQSTETVNISATGNYNLTYTAPDDYAGNLGSTITRNVTVVDLSPIEIQILSITSTNTNNSYAKAGDNITVRLAVDDIIVKYDVELLNATPIVTNSSHEINATISIQNNTVIENYTTFDIFIENDQTITLNVTQDNLTDQNVFVDTIAPIISINGNITTYYLLQNRSTTLIPNAIVTDGDPNYNYTYTVTAKNNAILNTSVIGSSANYTYTPNPDGAGNIGANVSLFVTVIDYPPIAITNLTVHSNNSNNSYAKAGDQVNITIVTDGSDIVNITGSILGDENFTEHTSNGTIILSKTITQSDINGNFTFDIRVINSTDYASTITQENLAGNNIIIDTVPPIIYLYGVNNTISGLGLPYVDSGAISYDLSYGIKDVLGTGIVNTSAIGIYNITYSAPDFAGNPANITRTVDIQQLGPISLTSEASQFLVSPTSVVDYTDYPSLTDPYRVTTTSIGGTTYALIVAYASDGFTILNISTPDSPTLVFNATGNTRINADLDGPLGISITQIQNSPHAVITSALNSTMAIINITNPTLPVVKSIINNTAYPDITAPFAVSTVDIDDSVYALVASKSKSLIVIFNITDPNNPTQVTVLQDGEDYTLGGLAHITPIHMDNSTYILTSPRSNDSIGIIDIGNPKMPKQVALIKDNDTLALQGINSIETVSINGRTYALVAAAGESAMQIIDVTHPAFPFPVSTARSGEEYPALLSPHDVTVIKVEDSTYALLSAVTHDVIQIIDITNPQSPRPASNITLGTEYTHLEKPQTLDAVQIDGDAYVLIVGRDSDGIQIIKLEHEKTTQSPFSITSNGANSSYAKSGDTISVQIAINDTIYSHTAQILNLATHTAFEPNTINASAVISPVNVEGYANFTISLANYLGVTLNLTQTDLTTNVFVDTIPPTITLHGGANYTIFVNSTYIEPGVVASDGDPNYAQTYTITNNSLTFNTSIIGSNVIYTYTAASDGAGNLGESITRNVTVVDHNPLNITSLSVSSSNPNSSYAKAGDQVNITIVTDGSDITSITGPILGDESFANYTSGGTIILSKTITQSDTNGNLTFVIFVTNSSGYASRATHEDLIVDNIIIDTIRPNITLNGANNTVSVLDHSYIDVGATAYDLSYGSKTVQSTDTVTTNIEGNNTLRYTAPDDYAGNLGLSITRNVIVLDLPSISLVQSFTILPAGTLVNSTTIVKPDHVATFQIGTATYAGISSDKGITIINITDIESPTYVSRYNGKPIESFGELSPSFTAFVSIDDSTYALAEYGSRMSILKANNLVSFNHVTTVSDGQDNFTELGSVSSITTATMGSSTYALVASEDDNGVQIINITTPGSPIATSAIPDNSNYSVLGGATSITTATIGSSTYALVAASTDNGVQIIDITNASNPTPASAVTDGLDYLVLQSARSITTATIGSSTYALVASEADHGVQIIDITNASNPTPASVVTDGSNYPELRGAYSITTTTIGSSTYALVASQSDNGVQIIDITNPYNPTPASYITDDSDTELSGARSISTIPGLPTYALVASELDDGIQIIQLAIPPKFNSDNPNPAYAKAGDTLTLQFAVNDTIVSNTTQFTNPDQTPSVTINNTIYIATVTVSSDPIEDYADFLITLENNQSVTLPVTENNFPSNVFVDTISPTIELVGDANYTVLVNTTYMDPGAIASDGSPEYSALDYTIINGSLNTSKIGSNTIYTYTADPDGAGNPGASITRNVTVINYNPLNITSLSVSSNNSNSSYAKAGDQVNITIVTDGSDITNAIGPILGNESFANHTSGGTIILSKTITQSDTNGNLTFDIFVTNSSGYADKVTHEDLLGDNIIIDTVLPIMYLYGTNNTLSDLGSSYVDLGAISYDLSYGVQNVTGTGVVNTSAIGPYNITYSASDFAGNLANITRTVNVQQLGPISLTNEASQFLVSPTTIVNDSADYPYLGDSYKVTTVKINNFTYALIGSYSDNGFTILNITIPASPTLVFNATGNTKINANLNGPTGISTIQIQSNTYAVITSLNNNRIAILDITNPTLPIVKSIINNTYTDKPSAVSTVDIDGSAYAILISSYHSRIVIFNITEPNNLTQVTVLQDGENYTLGGVTNIAPIKRDGSTYILTAARSNNSIGIIDIGNPKIPKQVALIKNNDDLVLDGATSIEAISINDRTYALVASARETAMQIIDVTHPVLPFPVSTARSGEEYPALLSPHDVTAIKVENSTYALLSAISNNSVQIIDITNPQSPRPASHITHGEEYTHLLKPQTLESVQINGTAYALIASRNSDAVQIIELEHEKTIQSPFSITSNGSDSSYAKAGDTVSVQISINDTIYSHTAQILDLATHTAFEPNTINASAVISPVNVEGYANFTILLTNYLGVTLNLTQTNLTTQNVFVDTIAPTITLNGDADYTVFVNSTYVEPGVVASDGDPNYAQTYTTINNSLTLNTSIIGSNVTYTYTADPDGAGNLGASITRNVTVVDYNPLGITSLSVSSSNSDSSYAKAGDQVNITIVTDGSDIANATGYILRNDSFANHTSGGTITLSKIITQNDTNGNLSFDIFVVNSTEYAARITQDDLTGSNIIIDTIPPNITLNGANNTVVEFGSTYTDPGANATDSSYEQTQIIYSATVVNTSIIDTYSLIYTPPNDPAGNEGQNITRIVTISDSTPAILDSLTATSNNNNPAYAKAGDNITITLNANQDISSSDIFIQNTTITGTIQSNILSANYTVQDGQNGNLTFEITAHFDSSLPFTANASDLASSIFIDTEKPTITLTGPTSLTVPTNHNYTDYMTNVTDNDPSYNETVSSNVSGVNTSKAGSYTVVYSANADTAGNIPDNKTRTVIISDFVLNISSDNTGSNTVAKTGDNITIKIVSSQYIGATITSATILGRADDASGITGNTVSVNTTVIDSDSEGNVEFSITLTPASGPSATLTHSDLTSANVVIDMTAPLPTSAITITPYLITVVFNEGIKTSQFASGVVSSNIGSITTLSIKDGPSIPSSILDLEVSLTTPLPSGAVPIIQLGDFGLSAISDIAGNEFAPTVVQASDGIPPSLHSATVVSSALIEVYFDEPVQLVPHASTINPPPRIDGKFATSNAISGDTLSIFSPSGAFQTDAILNISFTTSSIIDLAGNTFASGYVLTSESDSLQPYTINSTTIIVPYTAALDLNSLSTSDYRVSFDSNPPSGIRSVEIFNDTIVIITMQVSFGTGAIPFVEQPGTVTDILGNTITMQSAIARDRASPLLVIPILSTSTNTIAVEFSEPITSPSNNIANYDLSSTDGRSAIFGPTGAIITTSPFLDATFEISAPISIQDLTGNIANGTDQRVVINR